MSIAFSARWRVSSSGTPLARGPISTLSRTLSHGKRAKLWKTIATSSAGPSTGLPEIVTLPLVGWVRPEMMRRSVDLPEPERPSSATISPVFSVIETSSSTGLRLSPDPVANTWVTFSTLRSVAAAGSNMKSSVKKLRSVRLSNRSHKRKRRSA